MIAVDDEVFGPGPGEPAWYSSETFAVQAADDHSVASALVAAGERFFLVGHDGETYADADAADLSENCPVHYVSPPEVTEQGVKMYVDFGGSMVEEPMRTTLIAVLVEELTAAGVVDARVVNAEVPTSAEPQHSQTEWDSIKARLVEFRQRLAEGGPAAEDSNPPE